MTFVEQTVALRDASVILLIARHISFGWKVGPYILLVGRREPGRRLAN